MKIQFSKSRDGSIVLTLIRIDGTHTWSKLHPGLIDHDVAHYAVESVLEMENGFFGLVNKGAMISDFEDKEKRPHLHAEALQAEYLVNLLQTELNNPDGEIEIISLMKESLREGNLPFPENLTPHSLNEMRHLFRSQSERIKSLSIGEKLEYKLEFSN